MNLIKKLQNFWAKVELYWERYRFKAWMMISKRMSSVDKDEKIFMQGLMRLAKKAEKVEANKKIIANIK